MSRSEIPHETSLTQFPLEFEIDPPFELDFDEIMLWIFKMPFVYSECRLQIRVTAYKCMYQLRIEIVFFIWRSLFRYS